MEIEIHVEHISKYMLYNDIKIGCEALLKYISNQQYTKDSIKLISSN